MSQLINRTLRLLISCCFGAPHGVISRHFATQLAFLRYM
ncbi:hypothetical protein B194_3655 [Serratia plymuthica A30]|nr:hypothetical protein B194_3655 [Serratia plymuthica A30]